MAALLLVSAAAQTPPRPSGFTVLTRDGRRTIATHLVANNELLAIADLTSLFQISVFEDALAGGLTISYKGKSIVLTSGQTLVSVAGRLVSLPAPAVKDQRGWFVPPEFINRALASIYDTRLDVRKDSRLIVVGDLRVPRVAARVEQQANATRVVLDVNPRVPYTAAQDAQRIVVKFEADLLDPRLTAVEPGPIVSSIAVVEPAAVVINVTPKFGSFRANEVAVEGGVTRIVLEMFAAGASATPTPDVPEAAADPPVAFDPTPVSAIRTVVLDPGHGGDDNGATGTGGTFEKDITLSVARRLKGTIEARLGIRVLLTRDSDRSVSIDERASLANNNKADLFLSIHVNASVQRANRGAEVFYLSIAEYGEEAQRLASSVAERLAVFGGGSRDIEIIPWDMAQASHIGSSGVLARLVERRLRESVDMSPRALQGAPFRVLVGANMPAVLVELGFITNAEQEKELTGESFQSSAVQALYSAIVGFRDHLDRYQFAPAAPAAPPAPASSSPAPPGDRR
jgi:N-acetylmuramoyl-L-alanine amidase